MAPVGSGLRAIVRRPSRRIAEGEVTHIERVPLDIDLGLRQHAAYLLLLEDLGVTLIHAPETDEHPDGLFVEDALVMVAGHAIITRPGAPSRRGETATIEPLLRERSIPLSVITGGTLDGGDVLCVGDHVFIGLTTRTTREAIDQFASIVRPLGRMTVALSVPGCLHLKSAITALPDGSLIGVDGWFDPAPFASAGFTVHPADEPSGGDVLCIDDTVILPADAPRTARRIRSLGFTPAPIDVSELQKIEAGVTCMSVVL
jgi:dimethylargininase